VSSFLPPSLSFPPPPPPLPLSQLVGLTVSNLFPIEHHLSDSPPFSLGIFSYILPFTFPFFPDLLFSLVADYFRPNPSLLPCKFPSCLVFPPNSRQIFSSPADHTPLFLFQLGPTFTHPSSPHPFFFFIFGVNFPPLSFPFLSPDSAVKISVGFSPTLPFAPHLPGHRCSSNAYRFSSCHFYLPPERGIDFRFFQLRDFCPPSFKESAFFFRSSFRASFFFPCPPP